MKFSLCPSYSSSILYKSSKDLWDGLPNCKNKSVFVKPNLVSPPSKWDYQSCTHVEVTRMVLKRILEDDPESIVVGECGFKNKWQETMTLSGYPDLLKLDPRIQLIALQDGENFYKFTLERLKKGQYLSLYGVKFSDYLLDCDFTINIPKLKVHAIALITGAIKNMMGTMSQKGSMHPHSSIDIIHKRLRDFYLLIQPKVAFCLMDGIIGAEYSEQYGVPVSSNLLISETDCWRMDCAAASAMSISPQEVQYLKYIKSHLKEDWPELIPEELRKPYEKPLAWR